MSFVLIGMMGSGKTSVGKELAALLNLPWKDLDHELVARWGPVAKQFEELGEPGFRERESGLLRELLDGETKVLSGGGGIVLKPANRDLLSGHHTVYLEVPLQELERRLAGPEAGTRPLLSGQDIGTVLRRLFEERGRFYKECAEITVPGWPGEPKKIAMNVLGALQELS